MGAMHATVRPAEIADEERLFALVGAFPTPTPPNRAAFRAALRTKLADDAYAVFVCEGDGRLSGYVSGCRQATFYAAGFTAWVDEILVAEDVRRRGVGKHLMEAFERWAAANGCVLVGLATGGAAAFYERLGYASRAAYFKKYLGSGERPR
jgi:GNAT superfamily N-acetyltransferase